jgi:hypothetical protein
LGLTFTVTTQEPRFKALIEVPETLQNFLLAFATFKVTLAFFGILIPICVASDLPVNFLPLATVGVATIGATQSEIESEPAALV